MPDSERIEPGSHEAKMPDMEGLLVDTAEAEAQVEEHESLMKDPSVKTVSIRRHGPYNRGGAEGEGHLRGQLTERDGSFESVNAAAETWVNSLPAEVEVEVIASPTGMPSTLVGLEVKDPSVKEVEEGERRINPRRASATSALYAAKLRDRFGAEFGGHLASADMKEQGVAAREALGLEEPANARQHDKRLGDIFEYTTAEESQYIGKFFATLSKTYEGGMGNKNFWPDFIRGNLPKELNDAYLAAGGDTAIEKSALALEVIQDHLENPRSDKKEVALLVSHEEVIGSLAYQLQEYLDDNGLADDETIAALDANKFGYNEGFDIHVGSEGTATIEIAGKELKDIDLNDLKQYIASKVAAQEHLQGQE